MEYVSLKIRFKKWGATTIESGARILILKFSKNLWCDISIETVILHRLEPS